MWTYRQVLPVSSAHVAPLVAGLTAPDVTPGDRPCDLVLISAPPFVVTLADGTRVRPRVPSDGCHPSKDVLSILRTGTTTAISESRTTQVLGELETTTNCGDGAKSPAVWIGGPSAPTRAARPALPSSGSVSVCFYRSTADQEGALTRAGIVPVQTLSALWTQLPSSRTSACPRTSVEVDSTGVDWLMFMSTPRPPYRYGDSGASPIALLELGGCRRLVGVPAGLAGDVPAALATQLAALADQQVH